MSYHTDDGNNAGDMLNKPPLAPTSFSTETRKGRCVADDVCGSEYGVSSSLERALVTTGRDSALRRKYLHRRWQGAVERLQSRDKPHLHPTAQELWRSRRLRTPLGRALMRLNSN